MNENERKNEWTPENALAILTECARRPFETCGNKDPKLDIYNWNDAICSCLIKYGTHYRINVTVDHRFLNADFDTLRAINIAICDAVGITTSCYDGIKESDLMFSISDGGVEIGIRTEMPLVHKNGYSWLTVSAFEPFCFSTEKEHIVRTVFQFFAARLANIAKYCYDPADTICNCDEECSDSDVDAD